MAEIEITSDEDQIEEISSGRGLAALLRPVLNEILESQMTDHVGAERHEGTEERTDRRNGHYERAVTTHVGTIDLRVPRARDGSFSTELFERYQRSEEVLVLALMEMVVNGVSTRKIKNITEELCGREFAKSTVSDLCTDLNGQVEAWYERPLDDFEYPFVLVDVMQIKVRRQGAVRSTSALVLVGVNEDGSRESLGVRIANSESKETWKETFRWLLRSAASQVSSWSFPTLTRASSMRCACFFQGASWQRCQTHFRRNIIEKTPSSYEDAMHDGLHEIFGADDPSEARSAFNELAADLEGKADQALDALELGLEHATEVLRLPNKYRRRLRTTNALKRLIEEVRRREKVIRIFPNEEFAWFLIRAYLAERHEEWSTGRRYFSMDEYEAWKRSIEQEEGP